MERISSYGHITPTGEWYDQREEEWVALLRGAATLKFISGELELKAGEYLSIPRGMKHRVERVSEDAVWLTIHHSKEA